VAQGVAYIRECLGVTMPYGGTHPVMGTHNHLMRLGNGLFLEVLAIDPDIDPPSRPRWFGLDDPFIRQRIAKKPVLLTWVVNTDHINQLLKQAPISFGKAELISRGELKWYFGLPRDGRLLSGGILPYAIEWQTPYHPAGKMADLGCRFKRLEIYHSNIPWLRDMLNAIGAAELVTLHALPAGEMPFLKAYIETPRGLKRIQSDWA